jgi:hypothetical protein
MLTEQINLFNRNVLYNKISFEKSPNVGQPLNKKKQFQIVDFTMILQLDIWQEKICFSENNFVKNINNFGSIESVGFLSGIFSPDRDDF